MASVGEVIQRVFNSSNNTFDVSQKGSIISQHSLFEGATITAGSTLSDYINVKGREIRSVIRFQDVLSFSVEMIPSMDGGSRIGDILEYINYGASAVGLGKQELYNDYIKLEINNNDTFDTTITKFLTTVYV
jgi:hypothetical protein